MSFALLVLGVLGGCDDETILVENNAPVRENRAPQIIAQGPGFPNPVDEQLPYDEFNELYVIVADSDGVNDIAAVYLSIDSLAVRRVIVRPTSDGCVEPIYADFDTVDVDSLLLRAFPTVVVIPLKNEGVGLYRIAPCTPPRGVFAPDGDPCPLFPRFDRIPPRIGLPVPRCLVGDEYLAIFGLYSPDAGFVRNLALTLADIEYFGISVTVVDIAGASATARFDNVRVWHSTFAEALYKP